MRILKIITLVTALLVTESLSAITLNVSQAIDLALENSEELLSAKKAVEQSRLNRQIAKTGYLPGFSGNATGMWRLPDSKTDMGMSLCMRGVYMAGISLTQPIFAGGKIIASNKLAGIGVIVANEQLRQTRIKIKANAETSYWSYVAVLSKLEMMNSYRALIDTAYSQTKAAFDAGMATKNDLLRIEARQGQVKYQQEQVVNGVELCRMALCDALGLALDTPVTVEDSEIPVETALDLENYDLDSRPEMKLLRADIEAKRQQVRVTRADFLPLIGLQAGWSAMGNIKLDMMQQDADGNYTPVSNKINADGWNIMVSLQVPLFNWGKGLKSVRHARLEVDNARLNLNRNTRLLDLQVRQAIANVRTGEELVHSAETSLRQAEAALASTTQSYRLGLATITDLLDSQAQWQTSRSNLIEAKTQLRIHIIDYRAATAQI
ncbi:TolC family protein [uncultured Duncaniella sp.]|uniref:TolC family protein n=1 Tax=uncultured Duncaniella sp. TaxID=2768039 RepID=UPI0025EB1EA6|nr:TolC family protein [uncultured Duncaniella sp.]